MIRRRRGVADPACGHHWHATELGWQCCGCPGRVTAANPAPEVGVAACVAVPQAQDDSVVAWLATARPQQRGHRPGRRMLPRGARLGAG